MAYPKEQEHVAYLKYVEQWSLGEGEFADQPKMSKEEWLKKVGGDKAQTPSRRSSILGGVEVD